MGVDYQGFRFLLFAARAGVSFKTSVMFGRQNFADLSAKEVSSLLITFGHSAERLEIERLLSGQYIEPLLEMMGAASIASIDASNYENASFIHDLNLPLPEQMKNKFSAAIDFGTLEHMFNYPQALKNAMESVATGGHFLCVTQCNGFIGHGFYQFSPELFFRALSAENGFELEYLFVCRAGKGQKWYRCIDPEVLKHRAEIVNG